MDDAVASAPPPPSQNHIHSRRRRNSIFNPLVVPVNLNLDHQSSSASTSSSFPSSHSPSTVDFDLIPVKPVSYTSLKDLLPSSTAVSSPRPSSPAQSASEDISIRNRLVQQAAWAYLQPVCTTPDSSGRNSLHRFSLKLLIKNTVTAIRSFFDRHIFHAFDGLLRAFGFRSSNR